MCISTNISSSEVSDSDNVHGTIFLRHTYKQLSKIFRFRVGAPTLDKTYTIKNGNLVQAFGLQMPKSHY